MCGPGRNVRGSVKLPVSAAVRSVCRQFRIYAWADPILESRTTHPRDPFRGDASARDARRRFFDAADTGGWQCAGLPRTCGAENRRSRHWMRTCGRVQPDIPPTLASIGLARQMISLAREAAGAASSSPTLVPERGLDVRHVAAPGGWSCQRPAHLSWLTVRPNWPPFRADSAGQSDSRSPSEGRSVGQSMKFLV